MDVEKIRLIKKQIIDAMSYIQQNGYFLLPNAVMQMKDDIQSIAMDITKDYPYISSRLQTLRNELFLSVPLGYTLEYVTIGQVVEILDYLLHESKNPKQDMWSLIHPRIIKSSKDLFLDGHWTNAATDAFVEINTRVKNIFKIVSPNANVPDGTKAMTTVFSINNPLVKIGDLNDQTCHDKQVGLMNMLQGAISALRNPKCHDNEEIITREEAIRRLMFASTLMYLIDEAVVFSNIAE
ncbi:MAG: TIGR02391 family protein [Clostridia bacterium]|nr:TIGR02391 family protein [Clostridia bacterium]